MTLESLLVALTWVAVAMIIVWVNLKVRRIDRDGGWHPVKPSSAELRMRRMLPDGSWEYRPMTETEEVEAQLNQGW